MSKMLELPCFQPVEVVLGGVGLPGVLALHAVGEVGEHVEGVAAGGEGSGQTGVHQGRGEAAGGQPGQGERDVVEQHGGQHAGAGEEQGGVVVVDVEHAPHRPEGDVVQRPAQEEPLAPQVDGPLSGSAG